MSRQESDREDLMREATALVRRVELRLPGMDDPVVAGWRAMGWLSVYFGGDPVYHFDGEGRLRRAFVSGKLYRSQGTTLARLMRSRTPGETVLVRYDLAAEELTAFLDDARERFRSLREAIRIGEAEVLRQVPAEWSVLVDVTDALSRVVEAGVTLSPAIKGSR